jgi:diadenosine tetraphosphate (Ap4A) HIT family hydrolase
MAEDCPFCEIDRERIWLDNEVGIALWDVYPVSEGHALVVPRRHVASIYDLSDCDQHSLWELVAEARHALLEKFSPNGFNIGINDGPVAGQTVMHAHIHIIPRYTGDVPDPRGGIRWVIPEAATYWEESS